MTYLVLTCGGLARYLRLIDYSPQPANLISSLYSEPSNVASRDGKCRTHLFLGVGSRAFRTQVAVSRVRHRLQLGTFVLDSSNWVLEAGAFAASRAMLLCCRRCSSPFIYLTRASLDRPRSLEMLELEARSPLPGRLLTLDVRSSVVG